MIGLVLAAGVGRRLRPYTDTLPKALIPLRDDGTSVLDATLANFSAVGCTEVAIVVGYCAHEIADRVPAWERTLGLSIELVHNPHAEDRNNAYSLWRARDALARGAIVANGDTFHPRSVTDAVRAAATSEIALAVDSGKALGDEEMKVRLDGRDRVVEISKGLPHDVDGEYIGVAGVPAARAAALVDALERTWRADENSFYEAAFQLLADEGVAPTACPTGGVAWVEIDDLRDLVRARELACLS